MFTAETHQSATSTDKAAILTLIDARRPEHHFGLAGSAAEIESRNLTISLSGDLAFAQGMVCLSGMRQGLDGREQFCLRESMWFERRTEGWRIIHELTSAPLPVDVASASRSMSSSKLRVDWAPQG
jgi:hypothetical protein